MTPDLERTVLQPYKLLVSEAPKRLSGTPSNHKVAFVVWLAVFPTVLATSALLTLIPFEVPLLVSALLNTALSVPPVVYFLLPMLCRWLEPWVYGAPGGRRRKD